MNKKEDGFELFYNEFKNWTKKQILHRTFDIILKDTEEIGEKDKEIERLKAREEECMNAYLRARQDVSEYEGKYVVAKYVIDELEKWLEEEQTRLARECSNIYEDGLGRTRLVNEDIFNEITRIKDKLKELKEGKENEKDIQKN